MLNPFSKLFDMPKFICFELVFCVHFIRMPPLIVLTVPLNVGLEKMFVIFLTDMFGFWPSCLWTNNCNILFSFHCWNPSFTALSELRQVHFPSISVNYSTLKTYADCPYRNRVENELELARYFIFCAANSLNKSVAQFLVTCLRVTC